MTTHPTLRPSTTSTMPAIQPSGLRKPKSEAMAALGAAAIAAPPWPGGGRLGRHCKRLHPQASLLSLGYDIPAEIVHELQRDAAQRDAAAAASSTISHTLAVDLGCGTGLAGAAMRPFCQGKLLGCDLSSGMLRLAKKKRGPDERRVL